MLHRESVSHGPAEVLAPKRRAVAGVDDTGIDAHAVFVALHRTGHHQADVQLARDRAQRGPVTVGECRVRGDHSQTGDLAQLGRQRFRETVGEILLAAAYGLERHDCDRRSVGSGGNASPHQ